MKTTMLILTAAAIALSCTTQAQAQTTTTANLTHGTHNSPGYGYQSMAEAYNTLAGMTAYTDAGDRLATGAPVPQWISASTQVYCLNNAQWTVADDANIAPNGQVWTFQCSDAAGNTVSATIHTTWSIFSFVNGGKGGSRRYYFKQYTLQPFSLDDAGNMIYSSVTVTTM